MGFNTNFHVRWSWVQNFHGRGYPELLQQKKVKEVFLLRKRYTAHKVPFKL